jgi:rubrerythrin
MNAFEYAMNMEQDGRKYYLDQAAKMSDPVLQKIFEELAVDELTHYNIFKTMAEGKKADYEAAFKTRILATTKNIFQKLQAQKKKIDAFPGNVKAAWEKALEIEDKSEKFYRDQAAKATDPEQKKIWNTISDEEHKHWVAISHVVQFIDRPNHWLENAEWSNLDPY